jgi:arabinogalactan endo-1,4-beta-galactosidase
MRILIFCCLLSALFSCGGTDCCVPPPKEEDKILIKGADVSFLPEIEEAGTTFYNASGTEQDVLDILKAKAVSIPFV